MIEKQSRGFWIASVGVLAMLIAGPTVALADLTTELATEVMMEDSAMNNLIIGDMINPPVGSMLNYQTFMQASGTYTYQTVPGSMIAGQPLSLSGGGNIVVTNPSGGIWEWDTYSNGSYPTVGTWSVTNHERIERIPDPNDPSGYRYLITSDYVYPGGGDLHIKVLTNSDVTVDVDWGYFTRNGIKVAGSDFSSKSFWNKDTGEWDVEVLPVYPQEPEYPPPIVVAGISSPGGGPGGFTATWVSTPEPASFLLIALGGVALLGCGRRL